MSKNAGSGATFTRVTVKFTGRVQGVGFRYTTALLAKDWPVTGFVRNEPDHSVTLLAEGPAKAVQGLLHALRSSRLGSCIRGEQVVKGPATGHYNEFEIRYG